MKYLSPLDVVLCLGGILFCFIGVLFVRLYILPLPDGAEGAPTYTVDCPLSYPELTESAAVGDEVIDAKEKLPLGTLIKKELLSNEEGLPFLRLSIKGGQLKGDALMLGNRERRIGEDLSLRLPLLRIDGCLSGIGV